MRRLIMFMIGLALLVIGIGHSTTWGQDSGPSIAPGVDIPLELEPFLYPPDSPGAPEGTVWGTAGGKMVPLAPGVSIPLETPQTLREWPETDVPSPGATMPGLPSHSSLR